MNSVACWMGLLTDSICPSYFPFVVIVILCQKIYYFLLSNFNMNFLNVRLINWQIFFFHHSQCELLLSFVPPWFKQAPVHTADELCMWYSTFAAFSIFSLSLALTFWLLGALEIDVSELILLRVYYRV